MSVMTEYTAVIIYFLSCLVIPLNKEMVMYEKDHGDYGDEGLHAKRTEMTTGQGA